MKPKAKQVTLFTAAPLLWAGLVAWGVGAAFDFGASGLYALIAVVAFLSFIVAVIVGLGSGRWRWAARLGAVLLGVISAMVAARIISAVQQEASKDAALPLIAAAERFRAATGTYPASLADLVPTYLPAEPRTQMGFRGTPFMYSSQSDRFLIYFPLPAWLHCTYDSQSRQWTIDD